MKKSNKQLSSDSKPDTSPSFKKIEPSLGDTATFVPQCFDNQWTTQKLLDKMVDEDRSFKDHEVGAKRKLIVRNEYIRGLVNSRTLVINRAFLYNNPTIHEDYDDSGPDPKLNRENRESFKQLIGEGVITPFFLMETSPIVAPQFETKAFEEWVKICHEVQPHCMRLSWELEPDSRVDENKRLINTKLAKRFHDYATNLWSTFIADEDSFLNPFGIELNTKEKTELEQVLQGMSEFCNHHLAGRRKAKAELQEEIDSLLKKESGDIDPENDPELSARIDDLRNRQNKINEFVFREDIYKQYVSKDNTDIPDGSYDGQKPYARYLKQLLDLRYNTNLSDAINGFAITPVDSIPRSALQELTKSRFQELEGKDFKSLISSLVISDVQENLWLTSMRELSLRDVIEVRKTDEWSNYVNNLENLLKGKSGHEILENAKNGNLIATVFDNYLSLSDKMTQMIIEKRSKRKMDQYTKKVEPVLDLIIDVGGIALHIAHYVHHKVYYGVHPSDMNFIGSTVTHFATEKILKKAAPVVVRFAINNSTDAFARQEFRHEMSNSFDLLRGYVESPYDLFSEITEFLSENGYAHSSKLQNAVGQKDKIVEDANVNYQEDEDAA